MSRYILSVPPVFYQTDLYCWAAGGASWLRATKLGVATPEQLIARFGGYLNADGSLPEGDPDDPGALKGGLKEVFRQLNVYLENITGFDFTYSYVSDKLKRKGHLLLLQGVGGDMGHTYVVYGVGVPSDDYFSVFDSLRGSGGHRNRKFSEVSGPNGIYVGWAAWAGPR
jgi:hypothetical protein